METLLGYSSIILIGNFNPAIFHPVWFDRFKILPIQEVQWAMGEEPTTKEFTAGDQKIIVKEVPRILVGHDSCELHFLSLNIKAEPGKFECNTFKRDKYNLIKETVAKTFSILAHTPISALGINFEGHAQFKQPSNIILKSLFAKKDEDFRRAIGEDYQIGGTLLLSADGLQTTLKLESSTRMENAVYYNVNFHRNIESKESEVALTLLQENYDKDLDKIVKIIIGLIGEPVKLWMP